MSQAPSASLSPGQSWPVTALRGGVRGARTPRLSHVHRSTASRRCWQARNRRDGSTMISCYTPSSGRHCHGYGGALRPRSLPAARPCALAAHTHHSPAQRRRHWLPRRHVLGRHHAGSPVHAQTAQAVSRQGGAGPAAWLLASVGRTLCRADGLLCEAGVLCGPVRRRWVVSATRLGGRSSSGAPLTAVFQVSVSASPRGMTFFGSH